MASNKTLIVLDSFEYKRKEPLFQEKVGQYCTPVFTYSEYENKLIHFFHRLPYVGGALTRLSYWWISFLKSISILFRYKSCKTKLFVNPIVGIFFSFLSRLFRVNNRLCVAGFLFEPKSNELYFRLRRWFVNFSYKKIDLIVVFSQNEVDTYKTMFPKLAEKFVFVKYGRDYEYANRELFDENGFYISSGGRSNRDFGTLCRAMEGLQERFSDLKCIIATRPEAIASIDVPKNTTIRYDIKLNRFGSFIENSAFFVLPIVETELSAGHMALFEAMYHQKIIVTTDIKSIRDYVTENEVYFYDPENPNSLAQVIETVYTNLKDSALNSKAVNAAHLYNNEFTFVALLERLVKLSKGA